MALSALDLKVQDRIATITINRPEKLNALNDATIAELSEVTAEVISRSDVGGMIITGAGNKAFVAGADIAELSTQDPRMAAERARRGQRVLTRIERAPKPSIAAINGFALGGGCELALACHIRLASNSARLGLPEVKLGINPGYGGTQRLPRIVGKGRALQMILTGEMIDAAEAYRIGLVNAVLPPDDLMSAARALMGSILERGPLAIAACIQAVNRGMDAPLDEGLEVEADAFALLASTSDMREGMSAFLEKRTPSFTGK